MTKFESLIHNRYWAKGREAVREEHLAKAVRLANKRPDVITKASPWARFLFFVQTKRFAEALEVALADRVFDDTLDELLLEYFKAREFSIAISAAQRCSSGEHRYEWLAKVGIELLKADQIDKALEVNTLIPVPYNTLGPDKVRQFRLHLQAFEQDKALRQTLAHMESVNDQAEMLAGPWAQLAIFLLSLKPMDHPGEGRHMGIHGIPTLGKVRDVIEHVAQHRGASYGFNPSDLESVTDRQTGEVEGRITVTAHEVGTLRG